MFTERNAIEEEYREINKLMDSLWSRKTELRLRLREIDDRDFKEKSISYDALNSLTDKLTEVIAQLSTIIPPVEVGQVIEHISKDINKEQIIPISNEDTQKQEVVNKIQEEVQKEKTYSAPLEKVSRERTCSVIKEILIENGRPMKAKEIEKEYYRRTNGRKYTNFYEQIKFAAKTFPRIKKKDRGTYFYDSPKEPIPLDNISQGNGEQLIQSV